MDRQDDQQKTFPGRDTSQGHIVLRTPLRKAMFIAGLVGFVILAAILATGCIPTPPT